VTARLLRRGASFPAKTGARTDSVAGGVGAPAKCFADLQWRVVMWRRDGTAEKMMEKKWRCAAREVAERSREEGNGVAMVALRTRKRWWRLDA